MPIILPKIPERIKIRKKVNILGVKLWVIRVKIVMIAIMIRLIFKPSNHPFLVAFFPMRRPAKNKDKIGIIILQMARV